MVVAGVASMHETAEELDNSGLLDKQTMRQFEDACLEPVRALMPAQIRALRKRERASQAILSRYLSVTTGLVCQSKRGMKRPQGPLLKLLLLVARNGPATVA